MNTLPRPSPCPENPESISDPNPDWPKCHIQIQQTVFSQATPIHFHLGIEKHHRAPTSSKSGMQEMQQKLQHEPLCKREGPVP